MRIGIASPFATSVGVWKRLADEGNEVRVWRGQLKADEPAILTSHRHVGEGIVPLCDSWYELLEWARAATPSLLFFDSSGLGRLADEARKAGVHVIGGGTFCDRLEKDRSYGRKVATRNDIDSPGVAEFSSIDACAAAASRIDRPVYFKTDAYLGGDATHKCADAEKLERYLRSIKRRNVSCILEECLDGPALSTERWWNGREWTGPYIFDLERKSFFPDGVGPSAGCAMNAVGFYEEEEPAIARMLDWGGFAEQFRRLEAPPGPYDVNAIIVEGEAKFLEWCARCGYDSWPTLQLLIEDLGGWLWHLATGTGEMPELTRADFALSVRLTVPPAPSEDVHRDEKASAVGTYVAGETGNLHSAPFVAYQLRTGPVTGEYEVAAAEALVGLSAAIGDSVEALADEVTLFPKESLDCPGLMYWPLGIKEAIHDDAGKVRGEGITDLPRGVHD